ncbi:hypothetical protein K488DRAFT_90145 [Vararia minispora EC-137]|uniref:Uncharacterized protein n=1 Tax=Vararia minispora EC-137 TaxID=1314806 RepID=A0ACB8Q8N6_9AGAM|nr:hypothetical protein K488DRAFT_90145 [Vararia minispora EC-137]
MAPTNPSKRKKSLYSSFAIFSPSSLDPSEISAAIQQLEDAVSESTISDILCQALKTDFSLEFLLSAFSVETFDFIKLALLSRFPTSSADFVGDSLSVQCLSRLSMSLWGLKLPDGIEPPNLGAWRSSVELSFLIAKQLAQMLSHPNAYFSLESGRGNGGKSRRQSKSGAGSHPVVDKKPFAALDVSVPTTQAQAQRLEKAVLTDQRVILENLLNVLRGHNIAFILKDRYTRVTEFNNFPETTGNASAVEPTDAHPPSGALGHFNRTSLLADLTYSVPNGFGEWKIFTTARARADLKSMRTADGKSFDNALRKLSDLSYGRFSPTNHKVITTHSPIDIFRARLPGDLRIIYQVDCVVEAVNDVPHQGEAHPYHSEMHREIWDKLGKRLGRRGLEYRQASNPRRGNNDIFSPLSFKDMQLSLDAIADVAEENEGSNDLSPEEQKEIRNLIAYALLYHELQVVGHPKSSLVLGRSGTGKTTTILFKIFGIERAWEQTAHSDASRPRQVFVTKSRMLAKKVEQDFMAFIRSETLTAHAPQHFIERASQFRAQNKTSLFASEDTGLWRSDLPHKFSELHDLHFPLFITFDDLCRMLLNDLLGHDGTQQRVGNFDHLKQKPLAARYLDAGVVGFDEFLSNYWGHFPQELTKSIAPSLAFAEIMGVIKGSEESMNSPGLKLDRLAYEHRRGQYMHYTLFEAYEQRLRKRFKYDFADKTHYLISVLKKRALPGGRKFDYLYVDEVQDNLV